MEVMLTPQICPSCQKPLPEIAPAGLCPECLMKAGFGTGVAPEAGQPSKTPAFIPPPVTELAKLFPQLEILGLLGQGGMGAVYKARQPVLDRLVALKILPTETASDPGFAERFTREARALARLDHPNIVGVHEFGQSGGFHYFLMEFVDGANLRQIEQAGNLTACEALQIIPQICEALQFAHDEGIVHRDIKPENILVDKRGRVKIADFGIAKIVGEAGRAGSPLPAGDPQPEGGAHGATRPTVSLTQDHVLGTPNYMAPEQVEHPQTVDHRADIYSLGVVFYEMLTGELPLGKFQPPSKKVQVDVRLDEIVLRALEKEPELRYQQASEVKSDVETIATTQSGVATSAPVAASNATAMVFAKAALIAVALAALAIGLYETFKTHRNKPANVPAAPVVDDPLKSEVNELLAQVFGVRASGNSQSKVLRQLREMGAKAIPAQVQALSQPGEIGSAAHLALLNNRITTNAVPELVQLLEHKDSEVRQHAASLVSHHIGVVRAKDTFALPALIKGLNDSNEYVREYMAIALSKFGSEAEQVVPALLGALKDRSRRVRIAAVRALTAVDAGQTAMVVPVLKEAVANGDARDRHWAAVYLQKLDPNNPELIPIFISSLTSSDSGMRMSAANCLGPYGSQASNAVPALFEMLKERGPEMQTAARRALIAIQPTALEK
jgi:HEAT repeat protein/predicted Ser/Thr protein kinase